jgi:hypothetical protein
MFEMGAFIFRGSFILQIPALFRVRQAARASEAAGLLRKAQYQRRLPDSGCGLPDAWELQGNVLHLRGGDFLEGPWFRVRKRDDRHAGTARPNKAVLSSSSETEIERRPIHGVRLRTTARCAHHTCPSSPYPRGATPFQQAKTPAARQDEVALPQPGTGGQCCRYSAEFQVQQARHGASQQTTPSSFNGNDGSGADRGDQPLQHT